VQDGNKASVQTRYDTESTNLDNHQFGGAVKVQGRADFHVRHGAGVRQFIAKLLSYCFTAWD